MKKRFHKQGAIRLCHSFAPCLVGIWIVLNMVTTERVYNSLEKQGKKFTLEQILQNDEEWLNAISESTWARIRKNSRWKQLKDLNNRLERFEKRFTNIERQLNEVLITLNNGNGGREYANREHR